MTQTTHDHVASLVGSFDPADFVVPTGREEQWRFTPLRRTGGLVDGTAVSGAGISLTVEAPEGVTTQQVRRAQYFGVVGWIFHLCAQGRAR